MRKGRDQRSVLGKWQTDGTYGVNGLLVSIDRFVDDVSDRDVAVADGNDAPDITEID